MSTATTDLPKALAPELTENVRAIITRWVADLRSGIPQAAGRLCDNLSTGLKGYCCMGVLALQDQLFEGQETWRRSYDIADRLVIVPTDDTISAPGERYSWLPDGVADFLKIRVPDAGSPGGSRGLEYLLADLNDCYRWTFAQIAELIEGFFLKGLPWADAYAAAKEHPSHKVDWDKIAEGWD